MRTNMKLVVISEKHQGKAIINIIIKGLDKEKKKTISLDNFEQALNNLHKQKDTNIGVLEWHNFNYSL